jgi:hypothetical protein
MAQSKRIGFRFRRLGVQVPLIVNFLNEMSGRSALSKLQQDVPHFLQRYCRNNFLNASYQQVLTGLTGSQQRLKPTYVRNPLASSSLLCSYIRHKVIRKHENAEKMSKRIFRMLGPRNKIWTGYEPLSPKLSLLQDSIASLKSRLPLLAMGNPDIYEESKRSLSKLLEIDSVLSKLEDDFHPLSMYPGMRPRLLDPTLPWSSAYLNSAMQGNASSIRGMMIRIGGPRKDNKAGSRKKMIGSSSLNSVDFVAGEASQVQLPSKMGIFGLNIRIAYCLRNRLANKETKVLALNVPRYKVDRDILGRLTCESTVFGFGNSMTLKDAALFRKEDELCAKLDAC